MLEKHTINLKEKYHNSNYFKEAYDFVLDSIHSCPSGSAEGWTHLVKFSFKVFFSLCKDARTYFPCYKGVWD